MYSGDNDGYLCGFHTGGAEHWWPIALLPYYRHPDLRVCPMATRFWTDGAPPDSPYTGWGVYEEGASAWFADAMVEGYETLYGSYGTNEYIGNVGEEGGGEGDDIFWRRVNVRRAGEIPMFLDCNFMGGFPDDMDDPPEYNGLFDVGISEMTRYCLDRHNAAINGAFLDFSVRRIDLKQLWVLQWHRSFRLNGPWTTAGGADRDDWAGHGTGWMKDFKEY
jgi:hypothetical protein